MKYLLLLFWMQTAVGGTVPVGTEVTLLAEFDTFEDCSRADIALMRAAGAWGLPNRGRYALSTKCVGMPTPRP